MADQPRVVYSSDDGGYYGERWVGGRYEQTIEVRSTKAEVLRDIRGGRWEEA